MLLLGSILNPKILQTLSCFELEKLFVGFLFVGLMGLSIWMKFVKVCMVMMTTQKMILSV
jgi:hypothetical protein